MPFDQVNNNGKIEPCFIFSLDISGGTFSENPSGRDEDFKGEIGAKLKFKKRSEAFGPKSRFRTAQLPALEVRDVGKCS